MKRDIPSGLSVYFDFMRFGAALIVVLSHLWPLFFPQFPLPWPGHSAVVVFFVLSGFVISHAARPELGLRRYIIHRSARIYPVALAVLLLVAVISQFPPATPLRYAGSGGSDWLDIGLNTFFLAQSWMNVSLPFNGPFWSLNYEVWYYILFGVWCYSRNRLLLAAVALAAGPKILLLLPVWLLGVVLQRRMVTLERRVALSVFVLTLGAALVFIWLDAGIRLREAMRVVWPDLIVSAEGSNQFAGDFILGLIVACNFMAAGSLRMRLLTRYENPIRYLSSFTFSIYAAHMPLAVLIWGVFGIHAAVPFFVLLAAGIFMVGTVTERRTAWYRRMLSELAFGPKQGQERRPLVAYDLEAAHAISKA